jgi:hypothetical protein
MEAAGLMFVGIAAAVVIPISLLLGVGMWFCWRGIQKTRKQSQELLKAPLVDIKNLKNGLYKIEGQIRAQDDLLRSPLSKKKCVYYRFHVEELRSSGHGRHRTSSWVTVVDDKKWIDFNIDDGTGDVEIDVGLAEVALKSKAFTSSGTFDGASQELEDLMNRRYGKSTKGWLFNKSMRYTESYLRDGDTVMIIGDVEKSKGEAPEFYKGDHHLLITDMDEKQVGSMYTGRATMYWIGMVFLGVFMLVTCGAGAIFGVVGAGVGIFAAKVPEIANRDRNPFGKDNPFERDRKKIEIPPPDNKLIAKPKPINPAWNDAKMTITWLSDMPEENPRVGWGKFGKNGQLGYTPEGFNPEAKIMVNGQHWTKAISFHPPDFGESVVQYRLNGQHKLLKAMVSLADLPPKVDRSMSPQVFKVFGDGQLLWVSNPVQQRKDQQSFRLSVENVQTLELRVHCGGGKGHAWSVWVNPQLLK